MPAANPLADYVPGPTPTALYNTGQTSGMNSGTTQSHATLSSGQFSAAAGNVGGNANITVATLVAISLAVLLGAHLLGFRAMFDASVGRK